jgi:hypothetical protein
MSSLETDIECKGCKMHNSPYSYITCFAPPHINNKNCPCLSCLVRPICEDSCQEQFDYHQYAIAIILTKYADKHKVV